MASARNFPVILTYHSISIGPSPLEIPPKIFVEQMEWLAARARVCSLAELVQTLKSASPLPERTAVITFDDGYADFAEHAAPVLARLKFPATVFLPTAHLGGFNTWSDAYLSRKPLMSWEQIRALAAQGITFGSHSVSHPNLTTLSEEALERELALSKAEIETHTGQRVEFFCYPYGRWSPKVRSAVLRHYLAACSTGAGLVEPDADPFALPRVDAHYVRNLSVFRTLFTERFAAYVGFRRMLRMLRGAPEGYYARNPA